MFIFSIYDSWVFLSYLKRSFLPQVLTNRDLDFLLIFHFNLVWIFIQLKLFWYVLFGKRSSFSLILYREPIITVFFIKQLSSYLHELKCCFVICKFIYNLGFLSEVCTVFTDVFVILVPIPYCLTDSILC